MNQWQAHEQAASIARKVMRELGFSVNAVAQIRQQNDGEFASVFKYQEEKLMEFLTDPRNTTIEYSRETKSRIFVKFTDRVMSTWPR